MQTFFRRLTLLSAILAAYGVAHAADVNDPVWDSAPDSAADRSDYSAAERSPPEARASLLRNPRRP